MKFQDSWRRLQLGSKASKRRQKSVTNERRALEERRVSKGTLKPGSRGHGRDYLGIGIRETQAPESTTVTEKFTMLTTYPTLMNRVMKDATCWNYS